MHSPWQMQQGLKPLLPWAPFTGLAQARGEEGFQALPCPPLLPLSPGPSTVQEMSLEQDSPWKESVAEAPVAYLVSLCSGPLIASLPAFLGHLGKSCRLESHPGGSSLFGMRAWTPCWGGLLRMPMAGPDPQTASYPQCYLCPNPSPPPPNALALPPLPTLLLL